MGVNEKIASFMLCMLWYDGRWIVMISDREIEYFISTIFQEYLSECKKSDFVCYNLTKGWFYDS